MTKEIEKLLYRPSEAFEAAGVSRSLGYRLIAEGTWPSVRIGRAIRIPAEALREWVAWTQTRSNAPRDGGSNR